MEDRKEFIINVLYYVLIFGLVYLFYNYLLGMLAPFILGFVFAYFALKIAKKVFKHDNKPIRMLSLLILYILVVVIISLFAALGINELIDFIGSIPSLYKTYVEPVLLNLSENIKDINTNLPIDTQIDLNSVVNNVLDSIKTIVSNVSSFLVKGATGVISNTTTILISTLTTIIASFFFVADFENIVDYLESLMSPKVKNVYIEAKDFFENTVFLVIKSYVLIMSLTFVELFIGLMLIGVENFALVSLIIAFLDILPILGVGTVLIPWGIFEIIVGNTVTGILILVLYLVITIIRNIIEPKIVGGNLELHPLATLFAMIIGAGLFGILGLFGMPLFLSFIVKRNKQVK